MREQLLRTYTQRLAPVEQPTGAETGNAIGACLLLACAIADVALRTYEAAAYPALLALICGWGGWTIARWRAWERAVTVTVNETRHVAEMGVDEKPPEKP